MTCQKRDLDSFAFAPHAEEAIKQLRSLATDSNPLNPSRRSRMITRTEAGKFGRIQLTSSTTTGSLDLRAVCSSLANLLQSKVSALLSSPLFAALRAIGPTQLDRVCRLNRAGELTDEDLNFHRRHTTTVRNRLQLDDRFMLAVDAAIEDFDITSVDLLPVFNARREVNISNSEAERAFSLVKNIVGERRQSLGPCRVRDLLWIIAHGPPCSKFNPFPSNDSRGSVPFRSTKYKSASFGRHWIY
jgi:hypothetical protein